MQRRVGIAYLLWLSLGFFGAHRFYLRDPGWGLVYALTGGLFMMGWFVDAFLLPRLVHETNRRALGSALPGARLLHR